MNTVFRNLSIGQSFDWINDSKPSFNSFYARCVKISTRKYRDETGMEHQVGSINANVFHIGDQSDLSLWIKSDK